MPEAETETLQKSLPIEEKKATKRKVDSKGGKAKWSSLDHIPPAMGWQMPKKQTGDVFMVAPYCSARRGEGCGWEKGSPTCRLRCAHCRCHHQRRRRHYHHQAAKNKASSNPRQLRVVHWLGVPAIGNRRPDCKSTWCRMAF